MSELAARKRTMNRQRMRSPALRLAKRCFVLLALGMSLILSGCRPEPPFPLREVIPEGPVQVDVMQLGLPRRAVEIVQRLEAHLAEHPEWWSEHVRSAPEGEPIPYDPRMGISEAEYLEFLELASAGTLNKVGEATLDFQWVSSRRVRLGAEGELAALNGIEIDVVLQRATTPFGTLPERVEIDNRSESSPTGPWRGVQWSGEVVAPDLSFGASVQLAIGRLSRDDRAILYYDAHWIDGDLIERVSLILFYEPRSSDASIAAARGR